jgi:hypothetical protein
MAALSPGRATLLSMGLRRLANGVWGLGPLAAGVLGCSLLQSVDGYEGPPLVAQDSSVLPDAAPDDADSAVTPPAACDGSAQCVDKNLCTNDTCTGGTCTHTIVQGNACGDDNPCNGQESCNSAGECEPGAPPGLDDGDPCTKDYCDAVKGVMHDPIDYPDITPVCFNNPCPADYYPISYACDPNCSVDCPYCLNSSACRRACGKTVNVCCNLGTNSCDVCPAGYSRVSGSEVSAMECGCPAANPPLPGTKVGCARNGAGGSGR